MTGLSGSGKTTLAQALEKSLFQKGHQVVVLDGDDLRKGISENLGFSDEDRLENIRRISHLASFLAKSGFITIVSLISPFKLGRKKARDICSPFFEVYIKSSLQSCEGRDIKGLYKKARAGEIPKFTGISSPYEGPENPDLVIETDHNTVSDSLSLLEEFVGKKFVDPLRDDSLGHYHI
jgi:adenylyl-sulfate kinase